MLGLGNETLTELKMHLCWVIHSLFRNTMQPAGKMNGQTIMKIDRTEEGERHCGREEGNVLKWDCLSGEYEQQLRATGMTSDVSVISSKWE